MKLRTWLSSTTGVIVTGTVLTLIVLAESLFPPWAPYFIFYALLAILIPVFLRTYRFGSFRDMWRTHWRLTVIIFVISLIWDRGITTWLYEWLLNELGLGADPFYSLNAALVALADRAALKFGITPDTALMLYALFILLWAPVGEELFYRGYIQGVLRQSTSFRASALASAAFFGIRHATHLFFLWPQVPLVAAGNWVLSAFGFGLLMSYLYEKTDSLYPPMLVHVAINLIGIVLSG